MTQFTSELMLSILPQFFIPMKHSKLHPSHIFPFVVVTPSSEHPKILFLLLNACALPCDVRAREPRDVIVENLVFTWHRP